MVWVFEEELVEDAPQQATKTSPVRLLGGAAREMLGRGIGAAAEAFGSSTMAEMQSQQDAQYYQLADIARQQGMSEEEIIQTMGYPPPERMSIVSGIDELTGGELIPQTAVEKTVAGGLGGAAEFAVMEGMLPGGGALAKMGEAAKVGGRFGVGESLAEQLGLGHVGQLAGGFAGVFGPEAMKQIPLMAKKGKDLLNSAVEFGKDLFRARGEIPTSEIPEFMKEVGTEKALADLELSQKELTKRTSKVSNADMETFENLSNIAEESATQPVDAFDASQVEKSLQQANRESILDTISLVDANPKESWEAVMKDVEERFQAAKESYKGLYQGAEQEAATIRHTPTNTAEAARKLTSQTDKTLFSIPEEKGLRKAANELVEKLAPDQSHIAERLVEDLAKENIFADYQVALKELNEVARMEGVPKAVTVDRLMATKRSINNVLSKADIIPAPVDLLRPVSRALALDIRAGLSKEPAALRMFEKAEELFAKTQDVFNNPNMVIARKSELPERLNTIFDKPSNLEKLNQALGEGSPFKRVADRMLVDDISRSSTAAARDKAKQLRSYMDPAANDALEELIKLSDKRTAIGSLERTRGRILDSLQESATNGTRPSYVLDLMKTRNGRALVNEVLSHSPKGRQMAKKLNSMLFGDIIGDLIKKDKVDYERLRKAFSDPNMRDIIVKEVGPEGLRDLQTIASRQNNMQKNLELLAERQPSIYRELIESDMGKKIMLLMAGGAPWTKGISAIPAIGAEIYTLNERKKLFDILRDKETRHALKTVSNARPHPKDIAKAVKVLIFASESED